MTLLSLSGVALEIEDKRLVIETKVNINALEQRLETDGPQNTNGR